jgi:hypothetical protein
LQIHLSGYGSEAKANEAGQMVAECLTALSEALQLNLELLDGITIAFDYPQALLQLDRGFAASQPLIPTTGSAEGVAMTPAVMRNGSIKAHIVLHASIAEALKQEDKIKLGTALYILAHEAAHVHDLHTRNRAFPGVLLTQTLSGEDGYLFQAADACWDEYAACRLSAPAYPDQLQQFETVFCEAFEGARDRANGFISQYWNDGDHGKVFRGVFAEYSVLLKYASYLLGHLDGMQMSLAEHLPQTNKLLAELDYFTPHLADLHACLQGMWETQESWQSIAIYEPLKAIVKKLVRAVGVEMSTVPQGLFIKVVQMPWMLPA